MTMSSTVPATSRTKRVDLREALLQDARQYHDDADLSS